MKRFLLMLAVAALVVAAGCGGFYAKTDMAAKIDANATKAVADRALAADGNMSEETAAGILLANAAIFAEYAETKTVDLFTYLFGKAKILVSGEYATRLDRADVLAEEVVRRTDPPPGWRREIIIRESNVLLYVRDAKDGVRSSP